MSQIYPPVTIQVPMSAWDKPMSEVRIAPTYKLASFSDQQSVASSQAPPTNPTVTDDDTSSLQSTISQLNIDNARYAEKQLELQEQLAALQISVTSLTSASNLSPDPSAAITQSI